MALGFASTGHRRHLFTPYKVAGGPDRDTRFKRYRITSGHYAASGIAFRITDDWLRAGNAHRALKESWIGETCFSEIPDYIEDTVAPRCGSISSLGPLRPPSLALPQPVREIPERQREAIPRPAVPLLRIDDPDVSRRDVQEKYIPSKVAGLRRCPGSFSASAGAALPDPPLLLCGGSYLSRRLGDRRVRGYTFAPCLGLSSSRADPSRVSGLPLRGAHRYNITDHPCGRRARYRARVRGGVLRSGDDTACWPLDGVSRHRRTGNGRTGDRDTARPAWLKSHPCGESS